MTGRQVVGYVLMSSPFVALFAFVVALHGIWVALGLFCAVAVVVAILLVGAEMAT